MGQQAREIYVEHQAQGHGQLDFSSVWLRGQPGKCLIGMTEA